MKCLYKSSLYLLLFLFAMLVVVQAAVLNVPMDNLKEEQHLTPRSSLPAGIVSKNVKFPQFDPQTGMVTCVRFVLPLKEL